MVNTLKKTRGLFLIGVKRYNAYNNRIFFWNTCITFFADYFPALARDGPSWNWPCAVPRLGGRKPSSDVIYQPRPELARDRWHDWRLHQNRNGAGTGGVSPGTSSYCNWRIHLSMHCSHCCQALPRFLGKFVWPVFCHFCSKLGAVFIFAKHIFNITFWVFFFRVFHHLATRTAACLAIVALPTLYRGRIWN